MQTTSIHDPDRYMADLRQILSQGRKRTGILVGAGAPMAIRVNACGVMVAEGGNPLIPDIEGITSGVIEALDPEARSVVETLKEGLTGEPTIEEILTQIRKLAQAIGSNSLHGVDGAGYGELGEKICERIGHQVKPKLPPGSNPYSRMASWIAGTARDHPIEIFTTNYDLLFEEAFEKARIPYFDGFSGSHRPFFDPASVSLNDLPARWSRLWKMHGSLGWELGDDVVIRTGSRSATGLIYPDHLKYDHITRLPYSALFERLRQFMRAPDTLLICTGFSFADSHVCAVLDEGLAANAHTAVLAFQYRPVEHERAAVSLALSRPNMIVYCPDVAIINGIKGRWLPGKSLNADWADIRGTYWKEATEGRFLLGDFGKLATFLAWTQALQLFSPESNPELLDVPDSPGATSDAES